MKFTADEVMTEAEAGRLRLCVDKEPGQRDEIFIRATDLAAWIKHPETPALLRIRVVSAIRALPALSGVMLVRVGP